MIGPERRIYTRRDAATLDRDLRLPDPDEDPRTWNILNGAQRAAALGLQTRNIAIETRELIRQQLDELRAIRLALQGKK